MHVRHTSDLVIVLRQLEAWEKKLRRDLRTTLQSETEDDFYLFLGSWRAPSAEDHRNG